MKSSDAARALGLAKSDPAKALALARSIIGSLDPPTTAVARWAEGTALYELGRNDEAIEVLGLAHAGATGTMRSRVAITLAAAEAASARVDDAAVRLELLIVDPDPVVAALAASQLGLIELHAGRLTGSLRLLLSAVSALENDPDETPALARVTGNIGHCLLLLGRLQESQPYHVASSRLAEETNQTIITAGALQNMGYTEMKLGRLPSAIDYLERSRLVYEQMPGSGRALATLFDDMADTYRFAGLSSESVRYARLAARVVRDGGNVEKQNDAEFRLAVCLLDAGDHAAACDLAEHVAKSYLTTGRPLHAYRAQLVVLEAQTQLSESPTASPTHEVMAWSNELAEAGWHSDAMAMRHHTARAAQQTGRSEDAAALLGAPEPVDSEDVNTRLEVHYGDALRALENPELFAVRMTQAFAAVHHIHARLTDPELRAGAARLCERFRRLEVGVAVDSASPTDLVQAEERWRGLAFRSGSQPAPDRTDSPLLAELRAASVDSHVTRAAADKNPNLVRRLEEQIRLEAFTAATASQSELPDGLSLSAVRSALGTRSLVEIVEVGATLFAAQIGSGDDRVWRCCSKAEAIRLSASMSATMSRLLRPGLSASASAAAAASLQADAAQLSESLLGEMSPVEELVVAPPAEFLELPWSLLTEGLAQVVSVAPSITIWLRAANPLDPGRAAIICGPDLAFAGRDVTSFQGAFGSSVLHEGATATSAHFRRLLQTCSVLHISAHGTFRSDSPRFSSLALSDGPSMLHELDYASAAPELVVLAACDAGRNVGNGVSALGAAIALLDAGSQCVIAPIHAIPDREISEVLRRFYAALPNNYPHTALVEVRQGIPVATPRLWATAHALQCIGSCPPYVSISPLDPP